MTLHISLPQDLESWISKSVSNGSYKDAASVIEAAIRHFAGCAEELETRDLFYGFSEEEIALLKQEFEQREQEIDRGDYVPRTLQEVMQNIQKRLF